MRSQKSLLALILSLSLIGLLFVFEASVAEAQAMVGDPYYFLKQQSIRFAIGCGALLVGYVMPIKFWQTTAPLWYVFGLCLLGLVFVPGIGLELNGAHRWLVVGGVVWQPIEVVKFSVITFFASWMCKHQRLAPFLFLTALPAGLVLMQPDLGSLLILLSICFGLYFMAGGKIGAIISIAVIGVVFLIGAVVSSPYRLQRITTYLNPESDPLGASFHIRQITLALGNGGWFGQGLGNSKQKYSYIPEASTDSIFAIVAEEVGFVGSAFLCALFGVYLYVLYQNVLKSQKNEYAFLLGSGIMVWIASQFILNLAAVVALVPLTGVPLPFFSYGGTSLVMILFINGIVMKAARES